MPIDAHAEEAPVDIWSIDLQRPRPIAISPDERERAARFLRELDRVHWSRARAALRAVLASYFDCGPLDFAFRIGPHGKPFIAGAIEFNLSHSGDHALVAVSRDVPVGVDIEQFRPNIDIAKLLERLGETGLPDSIPALYQRWTRREAASKALGAPLFEPVDPQVRVIGLSAPDGYAAAVAMPKFVPRPVYRGNL